MTDLGTGGPRETVAHRGDYRNPDGRAIAEWLPDAPADVRRCYDEGTGSTFGNLRLPSGAPPAAGHPVVVLIHGGGWAANWGYDYAEPLAEALTRAGLATWNIEYRRIGQRGGGWPGTLLDVAAAIDFLRVLAPEHALDLDRVVVAGHSAGGHLAVWAGARHRIPRDSPLSRPAPLPIRGVVGLDAWALDQAHEIERGIGSAQPEDNALLELLGVRTTAEALAIVDRGGLSPHRLLPTGVPLELWACSASFLTEANEHYARRVADAGDPVRLVVAEGANHFDVVDAAGPAFEPILRTMLEFADAAGDGRR